MSQQSTAVFKPANLALATIGLALGVFMQVLDMTIASVSLPTIAGNLSASVDQATWVITSFTVCQAITVPMTGFLTRIFGEVKVYIWAIILFTIFSFLCGAAGSLSSLVIFRALQGAACGPIYPVAQSLILSIYPAYKRGFAMSIIAVITVVAPIAGPILGGWITDSYSWRWIFYINIPLGIFAAVVVAIQMAGRPEKLSSPRIDWLGIFTLVLGVGALQTMLDLGNDWDWFESNAILALSIIAVITLLIWLFWELTDSAPLVDLKLFRYRNFSAGTITIVFGYSTFFGLQLILPLWLQNTLHYTPFWAGLAVAPMGIVPILTAYIIGRYAHRIDLRILTSISFIVMGTGCFMFSSLNTEVDFLTIVLIEIYFGIGTATFFMPILTILLSELQGQEVAEGSGTMTFLRTVGASFAASICTYLWNRGASVSHADLVEHINPYSQALNQSTNTSGNLDIAYLAQLNETISRQAMQISFNQLTASMGILFFCLIILIWFAKPPFIKGR